ncbi:NAD+ synthetase [Bacteroidetes bacterium UKL13-3]|nr:NAD+ synthetase [Bacteroidetes bacterium UKL13-3]HCP92974.1 NAD+ synthase [Bacteroidota bacterium]
MTSLTIALAQLNYHTGNFEYNTAKIIEHIYAAKADGVDLIVFSELCVCGYPPRDFLEFHDFIERCENSVQQIATACNGIAAIVGSPTVNPVIEGKDLYNSAYLLEDGKVKSLRHKTLLPNYDIFDEYRYFEPYRVFDLVVVKGLKIALTVCEDLWNINDNPMYIINPMDELYKLQPDVMINIAASPFSKKQLEIRQQVMIDNAQKYAMPLFYTNNIGAQTQLIFDGGSMVVDADGEIVDTLGYFKEARKNYRLTITDIGSIIQPLQTVTIDIPQTMQRIYDALVTGIKEYFTKQGFKQAVLGLSGGIDSALVLALAVEALGNENVKAVLLPSRYSTDHSISDAVKLAQNLNVPYEIIPIEKTFSALEETLSTQFAGLPFSIAEENMQSRSRGVILMALSNKFGYILLNTSNKSEMAVGYGTLYGDMCGGLSVIGDLYKTEVFELCRYINRNTEIIPENIITKAPSAELRPDQKDSDSLPEYDLLDQILSLYIEERKGPNEIIASGFDETVVKRVLRMVNMNEWKRLQAPPVLRISSKAFGPGRRMPIVAKYLS